MSKRFLRSYYATNSVDSVLEKKVSEKLFTPFKGRKDRFMTAIEGVEKVRQGLFAFVMELSTMYKLMEDTYFEHEKCGLINVYYLKLENPYLGEKYILINLFENLS